MPMVADSFLSINKNDKAKSAGILGITKLLPNCLKYLCKIKLVCQIKAGLDPYRAEFVSKVTQVDPPNLQGELLQVPEKMG